MAFDVIVFNQEELLDALRRGVKSIALCDNTFTVPDIEGIQYTIIGNVTVENTLSDKKEDKPDEETVPAYANVEHTMMAYSSSFDSSFSSSFTGGSFWQGSYGGGSYAAGSYQSEYAYKFSSFSASFMAEYLSSYQTSFTSSFYSFISGMTSWSGFGGSFSLTGSFGSSYGYGYSYSGSFVSSYALPEDIIEYGSSGIIFVNGYGINLI